MYIIKRDILRELRGNEEHRGARFLGRGSRDLETRVHTRIPLADCAYENLSRRSCARKEERMNGARFIVGGGRRGGERDRELFIMPHAKFVKYVLIKGQRDF